MDLTAPAHPADVPDADALAVVPDAVPDAVLDAAVDHLRQLAHVALVDFAIAAGRYIVDTFFDGSLGEYYERSRSKDTSFNALCTRRADELAAIGLSRTTLRRYVQAFDTWRHLPVATRADLSLRTLELLRKVPDQVTRAELLLQAQREGWSPGALAEAANAKAEAMKPKPSGRGRPRLLAGEKELRGLVRQAQVVVEAREAISALPVGKLEALRAELVAALGAVEGVLAG